jgi:diguanylate cyclase (GGDEF)-like protein
MNEGADDYLTKPLDRVDLQVRLKVAERVMSLYRQVASARAELERLNVLLFEQSHRDPLTLLGNRLRLEEDLEVLQGRVERYGHTYCMALCDVDNFKKYNDTYGHQAGDHILRTVANTIVRRCRRGDAAYRYGGEEFLIILPEHTLVNATIAADHIRTAIEKLAVAHVKNPPGVVTVSVGVAGLSQKRHKSAAQLLRDADEALYRAKENGRNCVMLYQDESDGSPASSVDG